jgi:hypothetical protein
VTVRTHADTCPYTRSAASRTAGLSTRSGATTALDELTSAVPAGEISGYLGRWAGGATPSTSAD